MLATLIVSPILQLVVFGYAIDLDVDRIPTVVCDQDGTPRSRDLTQAFFADRTFVHSADVAEPDAAQDALEAGGAAAAVIIPRGFALRAARSDAPEVQVLVDGTDATRAQVAANAASQFLLGQGIGTEPVVQPAVAKAALALRAMFNERLKTALYMLPGVLATLLLNVTALVTAMGLARERESGTLEQVLVTPIRPSVLLAGKCLPHILFGLVDVLAILLLGNLIFDVPFRGSFGVIALGSFLYLFSKDLSGADLAARYAEPLTPALSPPLRPARAQRDAQAPHVDAVEDRRDILGRDAVRVRYSAQQRNERTAPVAGVGLPLSNAIAHHPRQPFGRRESLTGVRRALARVNRRGGGRALQPAIVFELVTVEEVGDKTACVTRVVEPG